MPAITQVSTPAVPPAFDLLVRRLDAPCDAERAFVHLYGESESAFWLDSAMGGRHGRFSFIGDATGPLGAVVTYEIGASRQRVSVGSQGTHGGRITVERDGATEVIDGSIFDYLTRELGRLRHLRPADLPFGFDCGFAGYLGYELKADCDGEAAHRAPLPDAALVFADRLIVFDHRERHTWLLCLAEADGKAEAERWLEQMSRRLTSLPPLADVAVSPGMREEVRHRREGEGSSMGAAAAREPFGFRPRRSRERYLDDIAACQRRLRAGETYEVCLTNQVVAGAAFEPLELYRLLRRANPAPFGAFLRLGEVAVLSSSPERFLRVGRDGWAESRPIKGTCRRGATPAEDARLAAQLVADPKSRAENVTIVDLVRNDLGIVCEPGSVEVPELMRVESYETVHQLVSTVRGRLRDGLGPLDCVRACFPPGSMTGAPKQRTMQILDELEGEARGPYSGAIGWLGLGGGCDLSVAIRTIVLDGETASIGAGGAIVLDSDPEREHEEMLLKARAPMAAIDSLSVIDRARPGSYAAGDR